MKTTPSYIDIFSGCGGLSLGLLNAGWNGLFALEKSPEAFSTLQHNLINNQTHFLWPSWLEIKNWDINEVLTSKETELKNLQGHVDLLVGGPPCQGFSTAGKRNILDPRNKLIHSYIKFVKLTKPSILLFENVSGFTYTMKDDKSNCEINFANTVVEKLKELGYTDAKGEMVNFSDYGIPQKRKRYLVIATLNNNSKVIFEELKSNKISFLRTKKLNSFTTVTDAISDLEKKHGLKQCPDSKSFLSGIVSKPRTKFQKYIQKSNQENYIPDSHRFVNHRRETIKVFKKLLKEAPRGTVILGDEREKFGIKKRSVTILDPESPSPTITTIPDDFVHYAEPRVMTPRECARLQTFPDWFEFKGPYTSGGERRRQVAPRYTQIGNAVPPLFAEQLGSAIMKVITNEKEDL